MPPQRPEREHDVMNLDLSGKRVLVAGGATGIGLACARAFAEAGATVTVGGLTQAEVDAAVASLGGSASGLAGDLTDGDRAKALYRFATADGPLDHLVNSVGIFEVRDFFETSDERWFQYFDVNVMTGVRMARLALKDMLARGEGSVVFISSESGIKPQPWMAHYGAMKSCLLGVSRALAELTMGTRVRVNTILPGPTNTDAVRRYHEQIAKERGTTREQVVADYFDQTEPTSLIRRMIEPEEIAASVLHLSTSSWLNGMAMRAEGGTIRAIA
jgi:NAD(P)-dependent dehydrogenase (short-subunit alcohol dehydrogenase family)